MTSSVLTSYQPAYVAISFLISIIGSFVALTAATRIRKADGSLSLINTVTAGVALGGIGVWAMHFIGMLALDLDLASSYSLLETAISLGAAILASSLALGFVAKAPERLARLLGAGLLLGLGVVFMHYLGMYGMKFGGYIEWDIGLVGLSTLIAVLAATAALWLAFNTPSLAGRVLAALVMGVAVCAMHYTGMAAAEFVCTTPNRGAIPQGFGYMSSFGLPTLVTIVTFLMVCIISVDQLFQRTLAVTGRSANTATR
ncbi:MHYT domain-containing protein [Polaromonas sp. SM01]|uniref:MHYT domain-containing protein n=1 Tax=Polaromonas sp. SM01 TaxID=3085630 RepID=UPI002981811A|nr:MHYT domain-containing protein [Polaromonas sp. SM01]MDW5445045.1 MHYT domain-containing protein [Polaromonas sp. SM01]